MCRLFGCCSAVLILFSFIAGSVEADNQTGTTSPVKVGVNLPYSVQLQQYDLGSAPIPSLHSFVAGEYQGQWVVIGGLSNGLHGFDVQVGTIEDRFQNSDVWVIDPTAKTSWNRSLIPSVNPNSGLIDQQLFSITSSNAQSQQVGDRLYMTGGYGDNSVADRADRDTFSNLTAFDLPGLVGWAKGGAGLATDHIRQISDPLFKVTGGDMYEDNGKMHLVFGHDFNKPYRQNANGEYTHQVRTFSIQDDGTSLGFTEIQRSGNSIDNPEFRRRDLNVYPTIKDNSGTLESGITALSGVFTTTRGAFTVPVEIDANGNATQVDHGNDPLNANGELDSDSLVFKQGMNNYHSAKLGLFSESTGAMHELLFGGITLQEYDPGNPNADINGFVTDNNLPNTNQISSIVRNADGSYEQHFLGEFPELFTDDNLDPQRLRFGSNAEFFLAKDIATYDNGVIDFDLLPYGETTIGYVYGGIIASAPHVFGNPEALSAASGEIFTVVLNKNAIAVPEPSSLALLGIISAAGFYFRRPIRQTTGKRHSFTLDA